MAEQATVIIQAKDQASLTLQRIGGRIEQLGNSAAKATSEARQFAVGGAKIAGAAMAAGYGIYRLSQAFIAFAKDGEQLNKTAFALERQLFQSGESADKFRAQMKSATGGESTAAELDKLAIKVRRLGFEWSQIPELMAAAKSQADITGDDVEATTEQLAKAMATGSQRALTPFGILIDKTSVLAEAARKAGIPVAALTEEQERSALISAGMAQLTGKLADSVDGLGSAAERAETRWTDAMDGIKKSIGGGIPNIFGAETEGAFKGKTGVEAQAEAAQRLAKVLADARAKAQKELEYQESRGFFGSEAALERVQERLDNLAGQEGEMYRAIRDNLTDMGAAAQATAEKIRGLDLSKGAGSAATDAWIASLDKQEDELVKAANAVRELGRGAGALGGPMLSAADAAETMAARLGEQRGNLMEVQAAYRATPEMLKAWQAELYQLQLTGEGASKRAADLELWAKVATDATKQISAMTDALGGFIDQSKALAGIRKVLPADADPAALARVADAMEQVQAAQKALEESIEKNEGMTIQRGRLEALSAASLQYIDAMRQAGVDGRALDQIQQMLVDSASQYAQRLYGLISEGSVFQTLAADARQLWAAMADPKSATGMLAALAEVEAEAYRLANAGKGKPEGKAQGGRGKGDQLDEFELADLADERRRESNAEYMAMLEKERAEVIATAQSEYEARASWLAQTAERYEWLQERERDAREHSEQEERDRLTRLREAWQFAAQTIAEQWSAASSAIGSAMTITGQEMTSFWSTTMSAIGDLTSSAVTTIGAALSDSMEDFGSGLASGMSALVPLIAALGANARAAAGVIGGIALMAAAVFGLTGYGWAVAGPLAALGASLIAYSLVPQKKASAKAMAPSVSASAAATSPSGAGGGAIYITQNFSGAPLISEEAIASVTAQGLRGMVGQGWRVPREALP